MTIRNANADKPINAAIRENSEKANCPRVSG
jgi:hypothetical protein